MLCNRSVRLPISESLRKLTLKAVGFFIFGGLLLLANIAFISKASAATLPTGFTESVLASGLSAPTAMAFSPDGRLFVTQQGGALRIIKNGALLSTPFVTVPTSANGERACSGLR